jgi:uncharacterized repeat protein (TIGR01451 family)
MPRKPRSLSLHVVLHAIRACIVLLLAGLFLVPGEPPALAEGSANLINNTGNRAYLEAHATATTAGVRRDNEFLVYAKAGETLALGSSAMNIGVGDIEVVSPDGSVNTTCKAIQATIVGAPVDYGRIDSRAEEVAGPLPAGGGYVPCTIDVVAATTGIWTVRFISPNPNDNINNNPLVRTTVAEWAGAGQPATVYWIIAWDISVRTTATNAVIPGRAFTTYLPLNLGSNGARLRATVNILTIDGYVYRVNMNGLDPFGFIFFANSEGFTDASGKSIYRSVQFQGPNTNPILPAAYRLHSPANEDALAPNDITHLIFFDYPAADLPETAPFFDEDTNAVANTWLFKAVVTAPPSINNFLFTGIEGTAGQMGTSPFGGNFSFDSTRPGGVSIQIDVNGNNVFNDAVDRTLTVAVETGQNEFYWDGLDGQGNPVTPGTIPFAAKVIGQYGEVHFPFFDAERNLDGISIQRLRDAGNANPAEVNVDPYLVYYNDSYNYNGSNVYDFSLCAETDTPTPPIPAAPVTQQPYCFGQPPAPRQALAGANSEVAGADTVGAHLWGDGGGSFGDRRGIDTWVFYPSNPVNLATGITVREADLSITKSHSPATFLPGGNITYLVVVTNNGPSPIVGGTVRDTIPSQISNVTWDCAITAGGGSCGSPNGSGNVISTTVDLDNGGVATYTIQGTLIASASGSVLNTACIDRPADVNDPNPNNNCANDNAPIEPVADLELNKALAAPLPARIGDPVTFVINLRNRGPADADNVTVLDDLPNEVTYVSSSASRGTYDPNTNTWTVGAIAVGEVLTLNVNAILNAPAFENVAQIGSSNRPDPDSTPGNNNPGEDDQSRTGLPIPQADVSLTKVVDRSVVNVGENATFTIVVRNDGPDTATGVEVTDRLPSGLAYVSAVPSQGTYNQITGLWDVGSLNNQATASLAVTAQILGAGTYTNTAEVSAMDQFDIDSTPNNGRAGEDDIASAVVQAALADLALNKSVNNFNPLIGEIITYTITMRNDGPSNTTGVAVREQTPAGLEYISHTVTQGTYDPATGIWLIGAVNNGAGATLTLTVRVASATQLTNVAQISASDLPDPDSTPGNNNPNEDDIGRVTIPTTPVDLALTKVIIGNPPTAIGGNVTFGVQVVNQGGTTATGVQVTDRLPAGLQYVSHTVSQGSYDPVSGRWDIGTLIGGATADLTVVAQVISTGTIVNIAEISRCDQPDVDSTPNNNLPAEDDIGRQPLTIVPTAITLVSFDATSSANGVVTVNWATGTERNTAGFILYRSTNGVRAEALRITPAMIAATGSASSGASYSFVDRTVTAGVSYNYWLREVEVGGGSTEYGPVSSKPSLSAGSNKVYLPMIWQ